MDKELSLTESSQICQLLKKLSPTVAGKWEKIGRKLGLREEDLAYIGRKRRKEQCLFATVSAWLNRKHVAKSGISSNVTYRTLVTVLQSEDVNETNLAKEIEMLKGGKRQTKTSYTPRVVKPTNIKAIVTHSQEHKESLTAPDPILETYLRGYYSKGSQHQKNEWPPSFNVKYINLMLIKQKKMPPTRIHAEKSVKLITQGDIEHVDGQRLALSDIMISDQRFILINGAPGVGKTRLAMQLRREWANKQLLHNFCMVLYIPLRDPIARLSENIDELLDYFEENCNDSDRKLIRKDHGKGILFILDGWDELRPSCREENRFFPRLIRGQTLPECCILVTSRPGSSLDIASHADQIIEILGFTQNEVREYIKAFFDDDEDTALKLIDSLETYPNIASTCYIAINLAIVCYVYHALEMKLPQTLTEVYQWFIVHSVKRHLNRHRQIENVTAEVPPIDQLEDFYGRNEFHELVKKRFNVLVKETLQRLGELALMGLQKDDLCFARKCLVETCKIDENDFQFDGFGLLKPMQVSLKARSEPHYHFLHLSIQEFIAAHYIKFNETNVTKWLVRDKKYEAVIKFLCGLDKFKLQPLRIFLTSSPKLSMFHLECTYEGQWLDFCKEIAKRCSNSFKFEGQNFHPRQWEVLGYVIANAGTQWCLEYSQSLLGERELKCFSRHLSDNDRALSHLSIDGAKIEHRAYSILARICQAQVALTELHLTNCNMKNDELCTIFDALKTHQFLKYLQIKDATVTIEIIDAIVDLLPTLPALKHIKLSFTCFKTQDYQPIIQCASKCTSVPDVTTPGDSIFPTMDDLSISSSYNVTSENHSKANTIADRSTSVITTGKFHKVENKHHSNILLQLKLHAAHWREIGIHLGFNAGELNNIESRPNLGATAPTSLLNAVLEEWFQWAPGDARGSQGFATLESLKDAVSKAGFGNTADQLHT